MSSDYNGEQGFSGSDAECFLNIYQLCHKVSLYMRPGIVGVVFSESRSWLGVDSWVTLDSSTEIV